MTLPFAIVVLMLVGAVMLAEMSISRRHEDRLRAKGAIEPADDVYRTMRWAYPGAFVAMSIEGMLLGPPPPEFVNAGAALMILAKALKFWAIRSLGERWTFRVLVVPQPLVTTGPYRWVRHPNYIAVVGELVSMVLLVGARVTGPIAVVLFGLLIRRRIRVEDRALRHLPCS